MSFGLEVRVASDGTTVMIVDPLGKLVAVMADHLMAGALAEYFSRAPALAEALAVLHNAASPSKAILDGTTLIDARMAARGVLKGLL